MEGDFIQLKTGDTVEYEVLEYHREVVPRKLTLECRGVVEIHDADLFQPGGHW